MADSLLTQSPCVIVLGMHRSGTSLLTGSLEAAGLYLGEVNNQAPFNRKGNKENESIRELNDALLERNGAAWNRPPNGQAQWSGADEEWSRSLISPYLAASRPWGFKDPRTVWTVEGWLRLLPHARPVGVFRHPSVEELRRAVVHDDDLVVQIIDAPLQRRQERPDGPGRLPLHPVRGDDDRQLGHGRPPFASSGRYQRMVPRSIRMCSGEPSSACSRRSPSRLMLNAGPTFQRPPSR